MNFVQNHPVSLILEPGTGYRVNAHYAIGDGGAVSIDVVVGLVDPTIWEAQAHACEQAAAGLKKLAQQFKDKANAQNLTR